MKPRNTLPLACPACHRQTHQLVAELQQGRAKCTGCGQAIKLTPEFLAVVRAIE